MIKKSPWRRHPNGFTLIEVMISMILVGILVAGLSGLWAMVADQFFRITLRQKAVFVLHGHMERIAMMYRTGKTMNLISTTDTYPTHPTPSEDHIIFTKSGTANDSDPLVETVPGNFTEGEILYSDRGGSGATREDRNVVWLDLEKNVTALLSWTLVDTSNAMPDTACYDESTTGSNCQLLTLYLDYAYRFSDGGESDPSLWDRDKTLALKTIVGRHR